MGIKDIKLNNLISKEPKEPKEKKVKEPKVKIPKEKKVKEPKVKEPKESKIKIPKVKIPKEKKIKEIKVKEPKKMEVKPTKIKSGLLGIRNKIYLCFLIPIAFMVLVGYVAYNKASEGLITKTKDASLQTVNMAVEYLELVSDNIQAEAARYTMDKDIESYVLGMPGKDNIEKATYYTDERVVFMSSQAANQFINNIHLITKSNVDMISSVTPDKKPGVYEVYVKEMEEIAGGPNNLPKWVTSHTTIDDALGLKAQETYISYQVQDGKKMAYIVVDVNYEAMKGILENMDFGDGAMVGLLTEDGKEISMDCGADAFLDQPLFVEQDFYKEASTSEELSGSRDVEYNGEEYLFIYQKSELNGMSLCALIPSATIVGEAESIKGTTVMLVLIAAIVAALIGSFIAAGIQGNMKRIARKLDDVARGDLTVEVKAKGHDEFRSLAASATNMVSNNKNLILSLSGTVDELQSSAVNVNDASSVIANYSSEITGAIDEISQGMEKQSEHASECVNITNELSDRIQDINNDVASIQKEIEAAQDLIQKGMRIVEELSEKATETSEMTSKVGDTIGKLEAEAKSISVFVQTINAISEQTNLLSLNASIEAARAGDAGRGFAVVAEEIRNLADNSSKATVEIDNKIKNINTQTKASVDSAHEAENMVAKQQQAVEGVTEVFNRIYNQMQELILSLGKISESVKAADKQRNDTIDAVDNISAIIEQTAANSSQVRDMASNLLSSVDRLGETADVLDANMDGLKKEIAVFHI